ncbi:MAG TPA: GNAT family N-acetyltransferase [Thermoanaerobaculia bacterium]|nr:GNAT family N-acetyltransferase [Thermoanaerobaculia bacterium]
MTIDRASITFRSRQQDDTAFLRDLYASTRSEELRVIDWPEQMKEQFLAMQFHAQTVYYDEHYDTSEFFIIEKDGRPIGRLYLDRQPEDLRIVDIALMPEWRGSGIGTMLLKEILEEAERSGTDVSIHVEHFNPAMKLYTRLGFEHVDTNGVYHLMRWRSTNRV